MDLMQTIITSVVQGLSEFLPISSSGHLIITSSLYKTFTGAELTSGGNQEVFYDIMLHIGTLVAVVIYFWGDLVNIFKSFFRAVKEKSFDNNPEAMMVPYVALGTIVTIAFALPFKDFFESLVSNPKGVGFFLLLTAFVLWFTEFYSQKHPRDNKLTWKKAVLIGLFQGFAVTPGLSRSGSTIAAGLLCGMDRVKSARYSFLLSIPVILLAALYHCIEVTGFEELKTFNWGLILLGSVLAAVVGYACIKYFLIFLGKYSLNFFAAYCVVVGLFAILYFK